MNGIPREDRTCAMYCCDKPVVLLVEWENEVDGGLHKTKICKECLGSDKIADYVTIIRHRPIEGG